MKGYLTTDYEMDHNLRMKFVSRFEGHLFQAMNRLDKERCIGRLEKNVFNLLQPHDVRAKAYDKFLEASPV